MRENRTRGSVLGPSGNRRSYNGMQPETVRRKGIEKRRRSIQTPTGFYDKAQGKREARHPGLVPIPDPEP